MKIELNGPSSSEALSDTTASRVSNSSTSSTQNTAEDRITFHSTSIQSLTSQALRSPEVRQNTVERLRQTVNDGQYNVDPKATANAIASNQP
jgi:flagellar biosynthesis anti-sigma factor FlgM